MASKRNTVKATVISITPSAPAVTAARKVKNVSRAISLGYIAAMKPEEVDVGTCDKCGKAVFAAPTITPVPLIQPWEHPGKRRPKAETFHFSCFFRV